MVEFLMFINHEALMLPSDQIIFPLWLGKLTNNMVMHKRKLIRNNYMIGIMHSLDININ